MSAVSVGASTVPFHGTGPGASPRTALHEIVIRPIPLVVAKVLIVREHYLHSLPGGTRLALGVFMGDRLVGAMSLGVGPFNAPSLVEDATADDCLTLTRLWLADEMPKNSESRVLGIVTRALRRYTGLKFLLAYADPSWGHRGVIYQASGWTYTGLSEAMPLYDIGDGIVRHSRSLAHAYGTHSVRHFRANGVPIRVVPQARKHRYVYFLDPAWRERLRVPVLSYPKRDNG